MSTAANPDDPGSAGDPRHPDTGTRDKVAAGNPAASADGPELSAKELKAQEQELHDREIQRGRELGISGADKMKRSDLQAELSRPEHFSSLLDRDTTHFDNVHYGVDNLTVINGGSGLGRQTAALAALNAIGVNVEVGTGWADNDASVRGFQAAHGLEETGEFDRATWDALGDELFPS